MFRVNRKGLFNVPFGHRKKVVLIDKVNLENVSKALKGVRIEHSDYKETLKHAKKGDYIFLDPPYYPTDGYADFKRYTKESFYETDHKELAQIFKSLVDRGCYVIQTNSNTKFVRKLYSKYRSIVVPSKRLINIDPKNRTSEDLIILGNL